MMHELQVTEFHRIQPLLTGDRVNMEIKAIAAGNSPGWVFVDDRTNPQTALVFSWGQGGFYFTGQENNPRFDSALEHTIIQLRPRLAELSIDYFEYSAVTAGWEESLERFFAHKDFEQSTQHVYLFPQISEVQLPAPHQESGWQVVEITEALLTNPTIDSAYIRKQILNWWDCLDRFLSLGTGYCVVCGGKTVALCFTSFVVDKQNWELGVYTETKYRKRGFAKEAAIRMLEACQRGNVKPYWDCMETNIPSRKLAAGLGFSLAFTYQVYEYPLN